MELSKLKHLFERQPQSDQHSIIYIPSIEVISETIETLEIDMDSYHSMIEHIINRKFVNKFHHQNGTNQHQHTNKNSSQK